MDHHIAIQWLVHWPLMGGLLHLVQRGGAIWYSEEGPGRAGAPPSPLIAVPNVTAHPSTASVPITVLLYNGPLLCGFSVPVKGLTELVQIDLGVLNMWAVKKVHAVVFGPPCALAQSEQWCVRAAVGVTFWHNASKKWTSSHLSFSEVQRWSTLVFSPPWASMGSVAVLSGLRRMLDVRCSPLQQLVRPMLFWRDDRLQSHKMSHCRSFDRGRSQIFMVGGPNFMWHISVCHH